MTWNTSKSRTSIFRAGEKADLSYRFSAEKIVPKKRRQCHPEQVQYASVHIAFHNSLHRPPPRLKPSRITPPSIALPRMGVRVAVVSFSQEPRSVGVRGTRIFGSKVDPFFSLEKGARVNRWKEKKTCCVHADASRS